MTDSEPPDAPALTPDHSALPPDQAEARARVGSSLRRLGHVLVGHHATVTQLDALTDDLDRQAAAIAGNDVRVFTEIADAGGYGFRIEAIFVAKLLGAKDAAEGDAVGQRERLRE